MTSASTPRNRPAIDINFMAPIADAAQRSTEVAATGVDGFFTFEAKQDAFFPLVPAAGSGLQIYTNVAIAFPRSPMHLAYQGWDLQRASGGRFALGLGTQIKTHIERRYSSTWGKPVAQMVDLIASIRAIWANWADGTPLDHHGDYYTVDLMTPVFVPDPLESGPPPIWVGALGPVMTRQMAAHADGIVIHPFNTGDFMAAHTMPRVNEGLEKAGKSRAELDLVVGCIAAPCQSDEEYERATQAMKFNLGFYASTPAYRVTLDHHGLGELQPRLKAATKAGDWATLGELMSDEVVDLLAVRGTPAEVAARLVDEYGDIADRLALTTAGSTDAAIAEMMSCLDSPD